MTPFGRKVRDWRRRRGLTQAQMAKALQVSPPYLSALEHGRRGQPSPVLVHQICAVLNIIWDDAEELHRLAALSRPRVVVDTSGLTPEATELANRLAETIHDLTPEQVQELLEILQRISEN